MPPATFNALTYADYDATADFARSLSDPQRWVRKAGVPIFKPHVRIDPNTKKEIRVDLQKLHVIAENMQKLENDGGVPVRITLGHTIPGQAETKQPPVAGYYRNARVGVFGPKREPAILADEWLDPQYAQVRKNYPYRSSEYYDDDRQITGVALLSRDPYLDLGVVAYDRGHTEAVPGPVMYHRDGTAAVSPYRYIFGESEMPRPVQPPPPPPVAEPQYPQYGQPQGQSYYGAPQPYAPEPQPVMYAAPQPEPVQYTEDGQQVQYGGPWPGPAYHKPSMNRTHSSNWQYRTGRRPTAYAPQGQQRPQGQQQQQTPQPYRVPAQPRGQQRPHRAPLRPTGYADNFGPDMGGGMPYDEFGPEQGMGGPPPMGGGMGAPPPGGMPPPGMDPNMGGQPGGDPAAALPQVVGLLEQVLNAIEPMVQGMEPNDTPPDSPFPEEDAESFDGGSPDGPPDEGGEEAEGKGGEDKDDYAYRGRQTAYAPISITNGQGQRTLTGVRPGMMRGNPGTPGIPRGSAGVGLSPQPNPQMVGAPRPTMGGQIRGRLAGQPPMPPPTMNNCGPGMYRTPQRPAPYRAPQRPAPYRAPQRPAPYRYERTPGEPMPNPRQPAPAGARPQQSQGRQAQPTQYSGQPQSQHRPPASNAAGARITLDRITYELEAVKQQNQVLMYERDQADTDTCVAEISKLASLGFPVDEYEVGQLKALPREHRQAYINTIVTRYARVPSDGIAPMMGDPSPNHEIDPPGPKQLTREGMEYAHKLMEANPGMSYDTAIQYAKGEAPVQYGPQAPGGYPGMVPQYGPQPAYPGMVPQYPNQPELQLNIPANTRD